MRASAEVSPVNSARAALNSVEVDAAETASSAASTTDAAADSVIGVGSDTRPEFTRAMGNVLVLGGTGWLGRSGRLEWHRPASNRCSRFRRRDGHTECRRRLVGARRRSRADDRGCGIHRRPRTRNRREASRPRCALLGRPAVATALAADRGHSHDDTAMTTRSNAAYGAASGTLRDIDETLCDILADERGRGLERERRAGLTRSEELRLLDELT
jgi:hypothetical protein